MECRTIAPHFHYRHKKIFSSRHIVVRSARRPKSKYGELCPRHFFLLHVIEHLQKTTDLTQWQWHFIVVHFYFCTFSCFDSGVKAFCSDCLELDWNMASAGSHLSMFDMPCFITKCRLLWDGPVSGCLMLLSEQILMCISDVCVMFARENSIIISCW